MAKPWYKSKTVWFNILTVGGAVTAGLVGLLPTVQFLISPATYAVVMTVVGMANIILRAVTDTGITRADTT